MDAERWQRIADIFLGALDREEPSRPRFISDEVDGDERMRQEVEALLASHEQAGDFMEAGVVCVASTTAAEPPERGDHQAPEHPTHRFGDYELLEEIARGGMGVVYRARQVSLNRPGGTEDGCRRRVGVAGTRPAVSHRSRGHGAPRSPRHRAHLRGRRA